jgi:hypothetical protein
LELDSGWRLTTQVIIRCPFVTAMWDRKRLGVRFDRRIGGLGCSCLLGGAGVGPYRRAAGLRRFRRARSPGLWVAGWARLFRFLLLQQLRPWPASGDNRDLCLCGGALLVAGSAQRSVTQEVLLVSDDIKRAGNPSSLRWILENFHDVWVDFLFYETWPRLKRSHFTRNIQKLQEGHTVTIPCLLIQPVSVVCVHNMSVEP